MPAIVLGRVVTTFVWVGLWLSSIATPTLAVPVRRAAVLPQDDPFYTPPAGYESSAPGEILRTRPVPNKLAAFSAFPQNIANAWQILYRTTDALGNPQATVTTVMEPHNPDATKLLSYQVAEDSAYQGCAPSYVLQAGTGLSDTASQAELLLMDAALDRGWYVSTPDYEGPNSAFTAGYSGGALASGWAAELQPTYAPELNIAGAAIGGTPGDLNATLYAVNKGLFVGLVPAGIVGLCQQYPELNEYVIANLKADKKDAFFKANSQCLDADTSQYAFQDMFSYFTNYNVLQGDVAVKILNENKMGKYVPKIPLHMYHSANDEMVPFAPTQALVKQYCSQGVNIEFVKDELSEHIILAITGAADALIWLNDRFNGVPVKQGCSSRTTLTSALDPGALAVFGKVIFNLLGDLLGKPIGPNSIAR
ncbi:hypothetical protein INT44_002702 [Umbelopsis vinacea]|uniref:Secretory lipase-domain-containing protein n=1 Tax=Umbelopsis vinacea TaxID=44442 RepID=A0A8H7Q704_9FUNG|nr:hypothetical protein INT44_002702 [Umbelopsis vinacea]